MNRKYERKTAARSGACYICYKDTTTVLRNTADWFYVCNSHLLDYSFCSKVEPEQHLPVPDALPQTADELTEVNKKTKIGVLESMVNYIAPAPKNVVEKKAEIIPDQIILAQNIFYLRERLKKEKSIPKPQSLNFPAVPKGGL